MPSIVPELAETHQEQKFQDMMCLQLCEFAGILSVNGLHSGRPDSMQVADHPELLPDPITSTDPPPSPHSETFRDRESFSKVSSDTEKRGTVSGPQALSAFRRPLGINTQQQ